jgi:4'-phosphopantetheinyl transferase
MQLEIRVCEDVKEPWSVPKLQEGSAHVWHYAVNRRTSDLSALHEFLSEDEQARAKRYHREEDRNTFILGRGALRVLLASYVGRLPAEVKFAYSSYGKPSLYSQSEYQGVQFNVSHSDGQVVLAVVRDRLIGIDVERIRVDVDARSLAEQFFSIRERDLLRHLRGRHFHDAFFGCWVLKEAYLKAIGKGLSVPLDHVDVTAALGQHIGPGTVVYGTPGACRGKSPEVDLPEYAAAVVIARNGVGNDSRNDQDPSERAPISSLHYRYTSDGRRLFVKGKVQVVCERVKQRMA